MNAALGKVDLVSAITNAIDEAAANGVPASDIEDILFDEARKFLANNAIKNGVWEPPDLNKTFG